MDNHEQDPLSAPKQKSGPLNGILRKKSDGNKTGLANNASGTNSVISVDAGSTMNANNNPGAPKLTPEQEAEKEKKRLAKKKERRATLILGLIMGSFIACWFPFFFLYSISPVCPICDGTDQGCCIQGWGFTLAFWLGYSNSALNPVIYTIFNKDFRRAFKRILFK